MTGTLLEAVADAIKGVGCVADYDKFCRNAAQTAIDTIYAHYVALAADERVVEEAHIGSTNAKWRGETVDERMLSALTAGLAKIREIGT